MSALSVVPRETLFTPEDFVQPTMPLELLQIGPNVRTDPGDLEELAASIREFGVLQPVKVQSSPAGWVVLWGQRRVLAARLAGLTEIPVIIAPPAAAAPASLSLEQLVENLQRADLNDIDEARALRAILDANPDLTHEAVADKLGKSRPWVSNSLRLLGLDEAVQAKVAAGEISGSHARALASLPPKQQDALATRIIRDKIPSKQIESELSWRAQEAEQDQARVTRTEKSIPKVIAILTEAKVPFDVEVQVSAGAYNFDVPALEKAIRAAGWKRWTNHYYSARPANGKCDCTAVRLDMGGRKPTIEPVCSDDRHLDRARNLERQADDAHRKAITARVLVLRGRIRAALDVVPIPVLILASAEHWQLAAVVETAKTMDPSSLRDEVAETLANRADASRMWNDRQKPMETALETLIGMLEPVDGEPAVADPPAKPAKGKKAASA